MFLEFGLTRFAGLEFSWTRSILARLSDDRLSGKGTDGSLRGKPC